eukprot:COSAG04_NODE_3172_length_3091_cov_1.249332_4_plen_93_part_00
MIVRAGGVRARDDSGVLGDAAHGRGGQLGQADCALTFELTLELTELTELTFVGLAGCVLMVVVVVQSNVLKDGSWVGARDGRIIRAEGMIEG